MNKVGFVGWRGMVGSVLLERMHTEGDFGAIAPTFFTTSNVGGEGPEINDIKHTLKDAYDLSTLLEMDVIISCQGGAYTESVHANLRDKGFNGYWIDAASTLRMNKDAVIVLDPVNLDLIEQAIDHGVKNFVGGNCTVSLLLMALDGLFKADLIEWVSAMTYQAASGAGAQNMRELIDQQGAIGDFAKAQQSSDSILTLDSKVSDFINSESMPTKAFGYPLAGNVLPFIDTEVDNGQSREEWKAQVEANKILGLEPATVAIDGTCVRVGTMRCHAQSLTIKLKEAVPIETVQSLLASANEWVEVIPNEKASSLSKLTPAAVAGKMHIPIGRLRKMHMGDEYLNAFTVGDQLLWGAAEPLRRMLCILNKREN